MEIALIILGAALALAGGIIGETLRTLRAGRAAALALYVELGQNKYAFGDWSGRARKAIGLARDHRPGGKRPTVLSAAELRDVARERGMPDQVPEFPRQARAVWDSQAPSLSQIARPDQLAAVGLFYVCSSPTTADVVSAVVLRRRVRLAEAACEDLMDLTFLGWAIQSAPAWRPWRLRR